MLPQSLNDLTAAIGYDAVIALAKAFPGTRIIVPQKPRDKPPRGIFYDAFVIAIGESATHALMDHAGGQAIYMPRCYKALLAARNARIQADYDSGMRVDDLAIAHKLSRRQIQTILNSAISPQNAAVGDLFGEFAGDVAPTGVSAPSPTTTTEAT